MFRVTREIRFCYGHRLLNYDGKCRHLHGHNGRAVITLESEGLDERGMVLDFSQLKKVVGSWIDATLDHRMLLHRDDPAVPFLRHFYELATPTGDAVLAWAIGVGIGVVGMLGALRLAG